MGIVSPSHFAAWGRLSRFLILGETQLEEIEPEWIEPEKIGLEESGFEETGALEVLLAAEMPPAAGGH